MLCLYYQHSISDSELTSSDEVQREAITENTTAACAHSVSNNMTSESVCCEGQFPRCNIHLNDEELSVFINTEMVYRRAEFVLNVGDDYGILKTESFSWLTFELIRRFGRRQNRAETTLFTIKGSKFEFSCDSTPMKFGEYTIFPLEFV